MKTALVLSGGGANVIYQVAAFGELKKAGLHFDVLAGVSGGALNGVMIAQDKDAELLEIWRTISEDQVFTKYSTLRVALRLLTGAKSLYDLSPLRKLIQQHVQVDRLVKKLYVGTVNMASGQYHSISSFASDQELQDAVYCSSVMPIVWAPASYKGQPHFADGGLRNIAPLSDVIDELPDLIVIVSCQPAGMNWAEPTSFIKIIKRTVDVFTSEIVANDLDKLLSINVLVLQASGQGAVLKNPKTGKVYKYFKTIIIRPQESLGDPTDFSREHLDRAFEQGLSDAKAIINPYL